MPILYRCAQLSDAPAISTLVCSLAGYFLDDPSSPDGEQFLTSISPGAIAERISAANYRYLLAEDSDGVCGVVAIRDDTHLYHLFVRANLHGQGVARELWARARGSDPNHGYTVNSSLFAVSVYERLGFVMAGDQQTKSGVTFQPMVYAART